MQKKYDRHFFEGWGGGTLKMIQLCAEANIIEPQFEEYSGGFSVIFYFPDFLQIHAIAPAPTSLNLTNRQKEVLKLLEKGDHLSLSEIVQALHDPPSKETVGDDLTVMKNKGLIQSEGKGRGAK